MKEHITRLQSFLEEIAPCLDDDSDGKAHALVDAIRWAIERLSNQERIAEQAPQWQPIETAPKTRKVILVCTPENQCVSLACWNKDDERWAHFYGIDNWIYLEITHWMPTPAKPEERTDVVCTPIAPDEALGKTEFIGTIDGFMAGITEIKNRTDRKCDQCAELEDLLEDIKPDADSDASGTLVERVEALLELAQPDKTRYDGTVIELIPYTRNITLRMFDLLEDKAAIGDRVTLIL